MLTKLPTAIFLFTVAIWFHSPIRESHAQKSERANKYTIESTGDAGAKFDLMLITKEKGDVKRELAKLTTPFKKEFTADSYHVWLDRPAGKGGKEGAAYIINVKKNGKYQVEFNGKVEPANTETYSTGDL